MKCNAHSRSYIVDTGAVHFLRLCPQTLPGNRYFPHAQRVATVRRVSVRSGQHRTVVHAAHDRHRAFNPRFTRECCTFPVIVRKPSRLTVKPWFANSSFQFAKPSIPFPSVRPASNARQLIAMRRPPTTLSLLLLTLTAVLRPCHGWPWPSLWSTAVGGGSSKAGGRGT